MPFNWSYTYEIGINRFDEHHKRLFELLNICHNSLNRSVSSSEFAYIVNELFDYTMYHFADEEQWMESHLYPKAEQHIEEHKIFCAQIVNLQKNQIDGINEISKDFVKFLVEWLLNHILKADADYGQYAKSRTLTAG